LEGAIEQPFETAIQVLTSNFFILE